MDRVTEMIKFQTGCTTEEAVGERIMAEETIRAYMGYDGKTPVSQFFATIVQIATYRILSKKAQAAAAENNTSGAVSESFSEGAVSVKTDYGTPGNITEKYQELIDGVLQRDLGRFRRPVVVDITAGKKCKK